jgi:hypothetical protein
MAETLRAAPPDEKTETLAEELTRDLNTVVNVTPIDGGQPDRESITITPTDGSGHLIGDDAETIIIDER